MCNARQRVAMSGPNDSWWDQEDWDAYEEILPELRKRAAYFDTDEDFEYDMMEQELRDKYPDWG